VDAFASKVFEGNPAAVMIVPSHIYHLQGIDKWMQQMAMEKNLSETAFSALRVAKESHNVEYDLRWFTPGR
jgi:PhzF family phenazine biosynthesis protein